MVKTATMESIDNEATLSFHNIRYVVKQKLNDSPFSIKTTKKEILCSLR